LFDKEDKDALSGKRGRREGGAEILSGNVFEKGGKEVLSGKTESTIPKRPHDRYKLVAF